ncbi:hypothetical protein [Paractinoplanes rishiriensis]|uniref:Uncharacterized protein n=1 Tax=Paractinoplanes rishiriensis TaxID=1050105 RepID=A0A919K445_9ACTN|nr:hypothetical protein [Actinoplanes rishiriensis]GIE98620.1 hypothetical protein Ari01nite_60850 [Actinoplanes rishiriensis]
MLLWAVQGAPPGCLSGAAFSSHTRLGPRPAWAIAPAITGPAGPLQNRSGREVRTASPLKTSATLVSA